MCKVRTAIALAIALVFLSACSESPSKPAGEATKPAEQPAAGPVTAIPAYYKMYESAYKWSPDIVLLYLAPKDPAAFTDSGGKAEVWEANFASASKREQHMFTYAVAAHPPDISKGVSVGHAIPWGGATREVMAIDKALVKVDSDAAFNTAAADAKEWLAKNSGAKMSHFQLGNSGNFPAPVWYVQWGDAKKGYAVYVNATTGEAMKKLRK
jgi:hypothetical protein